MTTIPVKSLVKFSPLPLPLTKRTLRFYSAPTDRAIPPSKQKYIPTSGHYPQGFLASSAHVGVKASNTRFDDLALIVSETPCSAAAVFTKNKFQAAPVTVTREMLKARKGSGVRAVVVNSGCANAVTGKGGLEDARKMGEETDRSLGGKDDGEGLSSVVMSTGVIGQRLPITKILDKIPTAVSALGNTHAHWLGTAHAICTTDTFPKLISRPFTLPSYPNTTFSLAGMTKGAGMIHPNMATLLSIIATDAPISPSALQSALTTAANASFNSISVDGDTSTNDTVAVLANGAASAQSHSGQFVTSSSETDSDYAAFSRELTALCTSLAQLIVRDGEGATKFVTIRVLGAQSRDVGHRIASTIARSPLVKTALYGRDANWGRILCAVGYAEGLPAGAVTPEKVSVSFVPAKTSGPAAAGPPVSSRTEGAESMRVEERTEAPVEESEELKLLVDGEPQNVDEQKAAKMLAEEDLEILVRLKPVQEMTENEAEVLFWTCDFSHEYVTINGDYRT